MNKIDKALARLTLKERGQTKSVLEKISANELAGLNIKKLRGHDDIFRVRKGDLRIIYRKQDEKIIVLAIERRSEKTYREY
ncbi:hypothetical protein A3F34_03305 [Candidatus Roizmanbacteria bacterium RIFCSPHIGHO2_12_FULL_44_10]|uniref:Type II toxin-antitoxin system RelE/ParE family toxin n=1 Tax=Candidatus Roizmanbacteria bacterium RIFCSPHIGHO2_12_FULL_44_10 TaxID=1802054 RepID=A0A1F7I9T8_9BACT|nr:MAG: hypothetical protein A3F34_03305 [Candidatus Roizmanbacteria bacterium RIFCSPHIGHO2_12_FULL_44_10]